MKNSKICLNSMVANESHVILRMLESCYKYIDYWVIQDNGSTDDTKEIIQNFFDEKNIPGFLYDVEWQYPGWNRNHTLQKCLESNHNCDWILRMDADEQLQVDDDFDWSILDSTDVQSWNILANAGDYNYFRTWLWNSKLPWFFAEDKRHETIHLPDIGEGFERKELPSSFKHIITNDGQTWSEPNKFIKDGLTLESDIIPNRKIEQDSYHLYYIAKSFYDDRHSVHLPFGEVMRKEFIRRSIFYFKLYIDSQHDYFKTGKVKRLDCTSYLSMCFLGDLYLQLSENHLAEKHYIDSQLFNPNRNEGLFELANFYWKNKRYKKMLEITTKMIEKPNPFPTYSFLINNSLYHDTGQRCIELHKEAKKLNNV